MILCSVPCAAKNTLFQVSQPWKQIPEDLEVTNKEGLGWQSQAESSRENKLMNLVEMEKKRELRASAKRVVHFQEKREGTGDRAGAVGGSHN